MLVHQVALVSDTTAVSFAQVAQVSAALQKQASRDFAPLWGVKATVDPFEKLEDVPVDYWPVIIKDDIGDPDALGYHQDNHGQQHLDRAWDSGGAAELSAAVDSMDELKDASLDLLTKRLPRPDGDGGGVYGPQFRKVA